MNQNDYQHFLKEMKIRILHQFHTERVYKLFEALFLRRTPEQQTEIMKCLHMPIHEYIINMKPLTKGLMKRREERIIVDS